MTSALIDKSKLFAWQTIKARVEINKLLISSDNTASLFFFLDPFILTFPEKRDILESTGIAE